MSFSLGLKRWVVPWGNSAYRSRVPRFAMFSTSVPEPVSFKLGDACKLVVQGGDITKWSVDRSTDAIVNAANETMLGGGGDGAIHAAAGKGLLNACKKLPLVAPDTRCRTGEAVITPGFDLPVSKIIHAVGPIYSADKDEKAASLLQAAYKNSLKLARSEGVKYIAFPAISCGIYGYPYDKAAAIAIASCKAECDGLAEIHFVLFQLPIFKEWIQAAEAAALPKIEANIEQGQV